MVFSSTVFLFLFLPAVLLLATLLPRALRNAGLLCASLLFYAWGETFYVAILLVSILLNYVFGRLLERDPETSNRKRILVLAIGANLAMLGFFKYFNFFLDNINLLLTTLGLEPAVARPVHLPIGISFFTFQAMSYIIDVYRRESSAQKNPANLALYISMFPQLVAGPIVRYADVSAQLDHRQVSLDGFASGLRRFIIGLGKKVLIANALALPADQIFGIRPEHLTTGMAWLATACYTFQIYFDFSGYSDMAIGLGQMFGFRFLENFRHPYVSRSIREFWRRWHISLSSWFRDYLFIPLGGSRVATWRTYLNLFIVFFLCGLWHGAAWNFVLWGLLHGLFLVLERTPVGGALQRAWRPFQHLYTIAVFTFGWVLFRADTLGQAGVFFKSLFGFAPGAGIRYTTALFLNNEILLVLFIAVFGCAPVIPALRGLWARAMQNRCAQRPAELDGGYSIARMVGLAAVLIASIASLASGTHNPFIYFRF